MQKRCFICQKNLSKITSILDAKHALRNWHPYFENKEYILYFSKNNISTCVPCGKQYFKWLLSRNKPTLINNRQLKGTNLKLTKLPCDQYANCVFCRTPTQYKETVPLDSRKYYLAAVGQCCPNCYMGICNTSTAYINSSDEELYL
jgi:hypothetical protein